MADHEHGKTPRDDDGGQVSEGPSGLGGAETSAGGADAVPETPDVMPDVRGGASTASNTERANDGNLPNG